MLRSLKECFNKKAFWGFLSDSMDPTLIGFHLLHLQFFTRGFTSSNVLKNKLTYSLIILSEWPKQTVD